MLPAGLIGFGMAGQAFHVPLISAVPGIELACIVERSGSLAQQKYPSVRVVRTVEELLADNRIRLCVIATPNATHFDLARQCLLAGRDVVIDKPFANSVAEGSELMRIAQDRSRLLTVFQNRRWDGDFLSVRKLLSENSLGRIVSYESNYDRYRPVVRADRWREQEWPGSGILFDLGPHALDQALVLFGTPLAITADIFSEREGAMVDDAFCLRLEYPAMHAILRSSMLASAPGPRFLLHGTSGSFVKYGVDAQEHALRQGEIPSGSRWGENPESEWGTLHIAEGEYPATQRVRTEDGDYRRFYENVRDAIVKGTPLDVPATEALRVIRAIEIAFESSRELRTIPWSQTGSYPVLHRT